MKTSRSALIAGVWALSAMSVYGARPAETQAEARGRIRVELEHLSGFYDEDLEKIKEAADVMEAVLSSGEFRQAVLGFTYDGEKQFADDSGLSNSEIYATIMAAKETYHAAEDHVAQLDLNLYTPPFYKKWRVVGYTYPGKPPIYMNSYYFHSFTTAQIAANMSHEWMHKIGFEHDYNATARRPYSVPYAVGDLVEKMASSLLQRG